MRLRIALVLVAFVALVAFRPHGARAAVVNGNFQDPLTLTLGSTATLGKYELSAPGWTITGTGGTFQPTIGTNKPYTSGDPNNRVEFLNGNDFDTSHTSVMEQTLLDTFEVGVDYLLTFDVGHRRDVGFPSLATAVIFDATTNTNLITLTLLDPGSDSFSTQSLVLGSSVASTVAGDNIGIRFTSNGSQLNLDNVSLASLPLPSALLLFVSGFGILGWAAGRHKHEAEA